MTKREYKDSKGHTITGVERELILLRTKVEVRSRHLQWSIALNVAFLIQFLISLRGK
jgi:hypothetical protein